MTKTVCITGASRGIGRELAIEFAEAGYQVFAGARTHSGIEDCHEAIRFVEMDVARSADHARLIKQAHEQTGQLDCYINNAGVSAWRPIEDIDDEFLEDMLAVNLKSAFWGCKHAAMAFANGGSIINISSLAARRGTPNNAAYCAAKFGMTGLMQAMTRELGSRDIRINAICPVLIETPGLMSALETENSPAAGDPRGFLDNFSRTQTALGRLPTASDVADLALFLASEAARSVTGQNINVDCGVLPQ